MAQADVEEPKLKSLVGHSQSGVTYGTYFGEGFRPEQLREAINKFDIEG